MDSNKSSHWVELIALLMICLTLLLIVWMVTR